MLRGPVVETINGVGDAIIVHVEQMHVCEQTHIWCEKSGHRFTLRLATRCGGFIFNFPLPNGAGPSHCIPRKGGMVRAVLYRKLDARKLGDLLAEKVRLSHQLEQVILRLAWSEPKWWRRPPDLYGMAWHTTSDHPLLWHRSVTQSKNLSTMKNEITSGVDPWPPDVQ